jgi:hypothetical protein
MTCSFLGSLISIITGLAFGLVAGRGDPRHPYFIGGIVGAIIDFICGFFIACGIMWLNDRLLFTPNAQKKKLYLKLRGYLSFSVIVIGPLITAVVSIVLAQVTASIIFSWR